MSSPEQANPLTVDARPLAELDPEINSAVQLELKRQQTHINLIASENFAMPAVMEAEGTVLTNKYAEGYPARRWYGGCELVDVAEQLAIDRAKTVFGADHANVQPHSGSQANGAVYFAALQPNDKMLTMDLSHGGHLTHGNPANFSGRLYTIVSYGVSRDNEKLDYDELADIAQREKPKMITVGASAYSRIIDFERMGKIARDSGALLMADIAHIAGLVAAGSHPTPVGHADFVTTTTHKTMRGPRGGLILCRQEWAKAIDAAVFPGSQGGPLMQVIAAKAVCFLEAAKPEFKIYQQQIISNAKTLAGTLTDRGYRIVSGGTDNHLLLVDLRNKDADLTGKTAQAVLDRANITCNKNTIPFETRSPFLASGIRLGTPAVTSRGMREAEMIVIADAIDKVLTHPDSDDVVNEAKSAMLGLCQRFPLPY
jgi:glycine hydroxymethyltransferase